jgi:hypothetical protein
MGVVRTVVATGVAMGASAKVMLAAIEAGLVESNLNNCSNGDRDSVGVFQQRPSWGTYAQRTDVAYASRSFLTKAIAREHQYSTAGRLAQAVQVSAFPYRYDTRAGQAARLIAAVESESDRSARPGIKEGSFVSYRGNAYRIAGGAPIYVSDWSHLGGDPGSVRTLSDSQWRGLRQYPVDGTLLSGSSPGDPKHGSLHVVADGAAVYRASSSPGSKDASRVVVVDLAAIKNAGGPGVWSHLKASSGDKTGTGSDAQTASQVPAAVGITEAKFPSKRVAVISWAASSGADYYRVRITLPNSTRRWRTMVALTNPSARYRSLRRGATYRMQITPVGPGGAGPTTTLTFRQQR